MSFNSENPKPIKQRQYGLKLSSAHKATTKERHCTPIDAEMHPKIADRTFLFSQPDFHSHVNLPSTLEPSFECVSLRRVRRILFKNSMRTMSQ